METVTSDRLESAIKSSKIATDEEEIMIKKELMFGSESGGFLDILATVATQQLDKLSRVEQKSFPDRSLTPKQGSRDLLADRIPYSEICRMSLNTVVRYFAKFRSDASTCIYSYKCCLMPPEDEISKAYPSFKGCDYETKPMRSELKAKSHIKNHLQSHIKTILDIGDYTFTSQPLNRETEDVKPEPIFVKMEQPEEINAKISPENFAESFREFNVAISHDHNYFSFETPKTRGEGVDDDEEEGEETEPSDEIYDFELLCDDVENNPTYSFVGNDPVYRLESNVACSINEKPRQPKPTGFSPVVGSEVVLEGTRRISSGSADSGFSEEDSAEKSMAIDAIKNLQAAGVSSSKLICSICLKQFTAYSSLLSHLKSVHAAMKPHQCHVCHKSFTRQQTLKYHMMAHQNDVKFSCDNCSRKFRHPSHFKEHMKRHHLKGAKITKPDILQTIVASTIGDIIKENTGEIRTERTDIFKDLSNTGITPYGSDLSTKQAFLATIDGRQVLLIPKEPTLANQGPSKLEQCLRFGSASVKE